MAQGVAYRLFKSRVWRPFSYPGALNLEGSLKLLQTSSTHTYLCLFNVRTYRYFWTVCSVNRFGKITSLWQVYEGLFCIWQNSEPTLAKLSCNRAIFHCCKWPNIERIIKPSGHTDCRYCVHDVATVVYLFENSWHSPKWRIDLFEKNIFFALKNINFVTALK